MIPGLFECVGESVYVTSISRGEGEGERERGREGERERGGDGGVGARDARTCVFATVCERESAASATAHSRAQTPALTHTNAVHGASALLRIALV